HRAGPGGAPGDGEPAVRAGRVVGVLFVLALPVLNGVSHALDRLMFRRQHGVLDALVALGNELPRLLDSRTLADTLTTALVTEIPTSHVSLQVVHEASDDLAVLSQARSEATPWAVPPRIAADLAAWLAL